MLLVTYDIADDKLRTSFSKFLSKYGRRLQYSVFEIQNSDRLLRILILEITKTYEKQFTEEDSVIIFEIGDNGQKHRFGYAKHDDEGLLMVT
ncbi:CRISPR-associated endonuclease Cas2 [Fibrobacter sp. HC4]|uniref:CRISPR-associated endonuclease Cas2 n=1 Tax=Fibrobacter sp. HC4 TaxID=3239812 RepID=UPI000DC21C80|nr:CRISPR-associated endonuclease Cas2 [Fibrobacter succinogenes]MCL4103290.1 CRISPR-associated endoribonuclease Cas2 [Fibrobacter succinogenes]MCQ2082729.1 CRISPR-associated endonuclease Cas2 [Lachnospiraceae bacterium]